VAQRGDDGVQLVHGLAADGEHVEVAVRGIEVAERERACGVHADEPRAEDDDEPIDERAVVGVDGGVRAQVASSSCFSRAW
jgi:hypothetical protein